MLPAGYPRNQRCIVTLVRLDPLDGTPPLPDADAEVVGEERR